MRPSQPLGVEPGEVRVRTFHALGREILRDAGVDVRDLVDRATVLAEVVPGLRPEDVGRYDTAFSRLKLELRVDPRDIAADPAAGPVAQAFVRYEAALAARGALDFDDLVRRALDRLEADPALLARWRGRCGHLLVDEVQDVDRSQLALALLLAAPANRVFLVGDDDQSIYGWRLADVRTVSWPSTRSCPGCGGSTSRSTIAAPPPSSSGPSDSSSTTTSGSPRSIRSRDGTRGRVVLAPDAADEPARTVRLLRHGRRPRTTARMAILARTNRELRPAVIAALDLELPFRAASVQLLVDDPRPGRPASERSRPRRRPGRSSSAWVVARRAASTTHPSTGDRAARLGGGLSGPGRARRRHRAGPVPAGGPATR